MFLKGWSALVGAIAVVSLSISGSSLDPEGRGPALASSAGTLAGTLPQRMSTQSVIFSSGLHDTPKGGAVILFDPQSRESRPGEFSESPDSPASLPEPGSGLLLGLGFLAAIPFARRRGILFGKVGG